MSTIWHELLGAYWIKLRFVLLKWMVHNTINTSGTVELVSLVMKHLANLIWWQEEGLVALLPFVAQKEIQFHRSRSVFQSAMFSSLDVFAQVDWCCLFQRNFLSFLHQQVQHLFYKAIFKTDPIGSISNMTQLGHFEIWLNWAISKLAQLPRFQIWFNWLIQKYDVIWRNMTKFLNTGF